MPVGDEEHLGSDMSGVARAGAVKLAGSVVSGVFGFVFLLVVTRGLGAGGTGAFFEAMALFLIASSLAKLGADVGFLRMIPAYRAKDRPRDLRPMLVAGLVPVAVIGAGVGAAVFALAPELSRLVSKGRHGDEIATYARLLAPFIVLNALSTVVTSATRGFETMLPLVVVNNIGRPLLRPALAVLALLAGLGGMGVALAWALPIVFGLVVALGWLARLLRRAERGGGGGPPASTLDIGVDFWRFSAPRALAAVFATTVTWLDTLLLGGLKGTVDAGVYAASTRYVNLGSFALTVLYLAISPQISAMLARGDERRAEAMYRTSTAWLVLSSWPIYLVLAVFAPFLLQVFGRGFVEGQTALMILSLAQLVAMAAGPANTVLLMGGHSVANTLNASLALVLNVALNLVLIPPLGVVGAALAWTASIVANNLAALVELRVMMRLSPAGRAVTIAAGASLLCFGAVGLASRVALGAGWAGLLVTLVGGGALYLGILWRCREPLELSALRSAVTTRARRRLGVGGPPPGGRGERHGRGRRAGGHEPPAPRRSGNSS